MAVDLVVLAPTHVSETAAKTMSLLLQQISSHARRLSRADLMAIAEQPNVTVFMAKVGADIVGITALVDAILPSRRTSYIEDVVVDEQHRSAGIGRQLVEAAIEYARRRGCVSVELTSNPQRIAANELYRRLGFDKCDTNVYRLDLGRKVRE
jgi:ribosomal protein S18 acetylase RimI-like enzyme